MKFGSLFSGIGGIDLGLERAGMECAWQVEINPFCQKVLAKHWPNVARYEDVRSISGRIGKGWSRYYHPDPVDLIAGGFPCQPHSYAGKRRGADDDRNLWPEYLRIITEYQPTWVVGENVPGIVTTILDQVLSDLEGMGYEAQTIIVPACAFDARHIRERVFILGHAVSVGFSREPRRGARKKSSNRHLELDKWFLENSDSRGLLQQGICEKQQGRTEIIGAGESVAYASRVGRRTRRENNTQESEEWRKSYRGSISGYVSNTASNGWGQMEQFDRETKEGASATGSPLQSVPNADGERRKEQRDTITNGAEFTTLECCNRWPAEPGVGRVANGVPHRVDRLRGLGNAVVPQVAEWIGKQIMRVETNEP